MNERKPVVRGPSYDEHLRSVKPPLGESANSYCTRVNSHLPSACGMENAQPSPAQPTSSRVRVPTAGRRLRREHIALAHKRSPHVSVHMCRSTRVAPHVSLHTCQSTRRVGTHVSVHTSCQSARSVKDKTVNLRLFTGNGADRA